jgi:hypothetical protein
MKSEAVRSFLNTRTLIKVIKINRTRNFTETKLRTLEIRGYQNRGCRGAAAILCSMDGLYCGACHWTQCKKVSWQAAETAPASRAPLILPHDTDVVAVVLIKSNALCSRIPVLCDIMQVTILTQTSQINNAINISH